ncbi:hypothetical protein H5410_038426, partial [Solanum commersonii]
KPWGKGEVFETSQLNKKIIGVEAGLSVLNKRLVVFENNFSSLETIVFEGLDEVMSNFEVLEKVNNEGLTNFELKLTEALSSFYREFETLKRQVDETAGAGIVGPVTVRETHIEGLELRNFMVKEMPKMLRTSCGKMDAYFEHVCITSEAAKIRTTVMYLSDTAMLWTTRAAVGLGKNVVVGMFNHMALFNHMTLAALVAQSASIRRVCGAEVVAKSDGGACIAQRGATLNFSSFEGKAYSCCASASLKRRVNYFPAFGGDLETLEEHVGALTCSQKWAPTEGTRLT